MKLTVIRSSSKGNAYLLEQEGSAVLLDAGVKMPAILEAVGYRPSSLSGALITHEHADHAESAKELALRGVPVYATRGTGEALGLLGNPRFHEVAYGELVRIPGYAFKPFRTVHDASQPAGYLLVAPGLKIAYATDTAFLTVLFAKLNYLVVECNYNAASIEQQEGVDPALRKRIIESHMSAETLEHYVANMDKRALRGIVLAHMSDSRGNADEFTNRISAAARGVPVHVADSGEVISDDAEF